MPSAPKGQSHTASRSAVESFFGFQVSFPAEALNPKPLNPKPLNLNLPAFTGV